MADISTEALQTVKSALTNFQTDISGISGRSINYSDSIIEEGKYHKQSQKLHKQKDKFKCLLKK